MALQRVLDDDLLAIKSVVTFYDSSDAVKPHEFSNFAAQLLENDSSMRSLLWAPRIKQPQRAAFESEARLNGLPDFKIVEDRDDAPLEASRREECYPVYYIEPQKEFAALRGYDLDSVPACQEAMQTARDTGELASTPEIILPGEAKQRPKQWIFLPVYEKKAALEAKAALNSVEKRRQSLQGFAAGTLSVGGIVGESFKTLMPVGIDLYIFNGPTAPKAEILHFHASRIYSADYHAVDLDEMLRQASMSLSDSLDIAGQKWTVLCIPSPQFISARITWQPWVTGTGCLLLTGLLASYLLTIAVRNEKTAHLAAILAATNQKLKYEIIDRRIAEELSQRENAKLSAMISAMEEGVVFADADNAIVEINNYLCQFVGKTREEIVGKRIEDFHSLELLNKILAHIEKFRKEVVAGPFVLQRPLGGKEVILRMQPIYRGRKIRRRPAEHNRCLRTRRGPPPGRSRQ